jgi:hypothetical protein
VIFDPSRLKWILHNSIFVHWIRKILGSVLQLRRATVICLAAVTSAQAASPDFARAAVADDLAAQVREIANTSMISRDRKERRITTTVRIAVVAATAYHDERNEVVGIAAQMATAAAGAAPSYAEVIAKAIGFVPSVSRYAGAAGEVRAAALAAARGRQRRSAGTLVRSHAAPRPPVTIGDAPPEPTEQASAPQEPAAAEPPAAMSSPAEAAAPSAAPATVENPAEPAASGDNANPADGASQAGPGTTAMGDNPEGESQSHGVSSRVSSQQPLIPLGDNASLTLSAGLGARRDSNIFLANTDKVAATILSATPGIDFAYGQNSLTHALLDYQESFNRYSAGQAPNVSLASASGNFGYDDGSLKVGGGGQYQQLYQNNVGILNITGSELIRSDVTNFNGSVESVLFSKIGAGIAANYSRIEFETPGLFGNRTLNVPLNLYFSVTPKVDLSAGYSYSVLTPDGDGSVAKVGYYNVGARGSFTSKLTGGFTVGYQTERVPEAPLTHDLGLTANLNYAITPKTKATFQAARDFETSAQGQVLKNGSYSLGLSSDITSQWQASLGVTYRTIDYGTELYSFESALVDQHRIDDYWESTLQLSYLVTRWFSTSASYLIRDNRSTLPGVEFSDNVFSLNVKFTY